MPHVSGFKINGAVVPSVTEIIGLINKPYLDTWKRKIGFDEADRIMNEAADLGRKAHDLVEQYLAGKTVPYTDEKTDKLFQAWLVWWLASGFTVVWSEKHLVSLKYKYQGSTDAILE